MSEPPQEASCASAEKSGDPAALRTAAGAEAVLLPLILKIAPYSSIIRMKAVPNPMESSLVLFSGGIDSTTALYWARQRYAIIYPLTFDYGQKHRVEIDQAAITAARVGLEPVLFKVDLTQVGGSALTDSKISIPKLDSLPEPGTWSPSTYVPFRNGIFLALAAAWAEPRGIQDLVCGFNIIDSPDYPDTGPEFIISMEKAIREGTLSGVKGRPLRIVAPFVRQKKSEIIRLGLELGVDYSHSISCYEGNEVPCSRCPACLLRRRAWEEAGWPDPLLTRLKKEGKI
jgi:7-cyano-7-deazaguanine synthase